ncbi:MAG: CBS domain-containing protein [Pseudomonadota bacterium]
MSKTPEEKKAGDLLIPASAYPQLPAWATLREALVQLTLEQEALSMHERRRKVLIFGEDYLLAGVLTQADILKALDPKLSQTPWDAAPSWQDLNTSAAHQQMEERVSRFMSAAGPGISLQEDLLRASQLMLQAQVDILPVYQENQLKGMLRLEDVFHQVSRAILTPIPGA